MLPTHIPLGSQQTGHLAPTASPAGAHRHPAAQSGLRPRNGPAGRCTSGMVAPADLTEHAGDGSGQAPSAAVGRFPRHKWPNQGNLSRASPQQGRPPGRPGPLSTPLALRLTAVPLGTAGTPAVSRVSLRCRKSGDPGTVLARPAQNCTRGAVRRAATGVNPLEPWRPHHVRPVALSPLLRPLDHGRRVPRAFGSQPVGD